MLSYLSIFLLMILEGIGFPVPSEVIIPLVGYYSRQGQIDFLTGILIGTLGSLSGSLIDFFIGYKLGYPFLKRYGKYFLIDDKKLEKLIIWFSRFGVLAVFFFRFVPEIRALISFPAGIAKMRLVKFVIPTFLGHFIWDFALGWLGYLFYYQINYIITFAERISELILILFIIAIVSYVVYRVTKRR